MSKHSLIEGYNKPFDLLDKYLIQKFPFVTYLQFQALTGLIISLAMWWIMGFDSTLDYFLYIHNFGKGIGDNPVHYGSGRHWSTFAMIFAQYYFLSRKLEKKNILGIRNILFSVGAVYTTHMIFEWPYIILYDVIHNKALSGGYWYICGYGLWQPLTDQILLFLIPWYGKGTTILARNGVWFLLLFVTYPLLIKYKPKLRLDRTSLFLFISLIVGWVVWIFYPYLGLPYQQYKGFLFPQTIYANYDPVTKEIVNDVWIPNDYIHFINVLVKFLTVLTFTYILNVKVEKSGNKNIQVNPSNIL
ncbi:MAG: hypothetical protein DRN20_06925 [Thermoplasmata archaeon]|nr:MAG: hypothetical protein DRN20_06925 [Thermoplasmata archaeon]